MASGPITSWQLDGEIVETVDDFIWGQLSNFTFTFHFHALEKEMATHSSILAGKILWIEEPGGLQSIGWQSRT